MNGIVNDHIEFEVPFLDHLEELVLVVGIAHRGMDAVLIVEDEATIVVDAVNLRVGEIVPPHEQAGSDDVVRNVTEATDADLQHVPHVEAALLHRLFIIRRVAPDALVSAIFGEQAFEIAHWRSSKLLNIETLWSALYHWNGSLLRASNRAHVFTSHSTFFVFPMCWPASQRTA